MSHSIDTSVPKKIPTYFHPVPSKIPHGVNYGLYSGVFDKKVQTVPSFDPNYSRNERDKYIQRDLPRLYCNINPYDAMNPPKDYLSKGLGNPLKKYTEEGKIFKYDMYYEPGNKNKTDYYNKDDTPYKEFTKL